MDAPPEPATALETQTDLDLLTTVGCAEYDEKLAEAALSVLYRRHGKFLMGLGFELTGDIDALDPELLLAKTFDKIWSSAAAFDSGRRSECTEEADAVKMWMVAILRNQFRDAVRALGRRPKILIFEPDQLQMKMDEDVVTEALWTAPADELEKDPKQKTLVTEWLNSLDARDRELMLISANYINMQSGRCEIPDDELNGLAAALGVLPACIKVKRQRLLKRLEQFLLEKA